MGYKKIKTNLTFTDISLFSSMEHNRAIKRMEQINAIVDWSHIEKLLMRNYPVGKSNEGNEAYKYRYSWKIGLAGVFLFSHNDPVVSQCISIDDVECLVGRSVVD